MAASIENKVCCSQFPRGGVTPHHPGYTGKHQGQSYGYMARHFIVVLRGGVNETG